MTLEKVQDLEVKTVEHSVLLGKVQETLDKMSNVLVEQEKTNQQLLSLEKRHEAKAVADEKRFKEHEHLINKNREQILKWSGAIAVIVFVIGVGLTVLSKFG